jgi:hypothetical protein
MFLIQLDVAEDASRPVPWSQNIRLRAGRLDSSPSSQRK